MMLKYISHPLPSAASLQAQQEERMYWRQCQRIYTFQPIYLTSGALMAIELLTAVWHPSAPEKRLSPELYFARIDIAQRLVVVREQLALLLEWNGYFCNHGLLASVNVDGPTLMALNKCALIRGLIARLPWVRFELVEHQILPQDEIFAQMPQLGPLWLDDFGSGMANFSALREQRYDHIKLSRELFMMLRRSEEGRSLFSMLLALINRYCKGVIVEGVETREEWEHVQNSPAFAAQGYYFARPQPFDQLETLPLNLTEV
ncbi:cyclic-guanylate-specific phosphodiesterase [Enterobacterales bacterium CwR94]|nr:cyclic-guanylate-specific phosphodiesterase [Enterobacterales bacterium CwR94]